MNKIINKNAKKILHKIDTLYGKYTNCDGKLILSEDALNVIDEVLKEGLLFYNEVVEEKDILTDGLKIIMHNVYTYAEKLHKTEQNAKKINLQNVVVIWQQLICALAVFCNTILDMQDEKPVLN